MKMIDLTGYSYVGLGKSESAAVTLSANTTYIVVPYGGDIDIRRAKSTSSPTIVSVSTYSDSGTVVTFKAKPVKFKTPASETWYALYGNVYKKN